MSDFEMISPHGREMFSYLPAYYETSRVIRASMNTTGAEMDMFYQALNETLDQFFIRTATWGLDRWEYEYGIPTDHTKPIDQRRAVVESKKRGVGKFSGRLVKSVAEAYDGGTVDVTFRPQEYSFTVKFISTIGIPPNLDDLKAVIEEIKPAHMAVDYKFRFYLYSDMALMTYSELTATGKTYEEVFKEGVS